MAYPYDNQFYPDMMIPGPADYTLPHRHYPPSPYHHYPGHHPHCPRPHHLGRVTIQGSITLNVRYVDHHGHVRVFRVVPGQTYEIDAFSETRGICHFVGKVVDYECVDGLQEILRAPNHSISISSLIIDASNSYESKQLRIRVENIERMIPILSPNDPAVPTPNAENFMIFDPFMEHKIEEMNSIENAGIPVDSYPDPTEPVVNDNQLDGTSLDDFLNNNNNP